MINRRDYDPPTDRLPHPGPPARDLADMITNPDAVDHGLTGEQQIRAWAALAAATALGPAIAKQADDTFDVDADLADMASWLAGYVRDGSVPL